MLRLRACVYTRGESPRSARGSLTLPRAQLIGALFELKRLETARAIFDEGLAKLQRQKMSQKAEARRRQKEEELVVRQVGTSPGRRPSTLGRPSGTTFRPSRRPRVDDWAWCPPASCGSR